MSLRPPQMKPFFFSQHRNLCEFKIFKGFMKYKVYLFIFAFVVTFSFAVENVSAQQNVRQSCRSGKDLSSWTCGRVIDADGNPVAGIDVRFSSAHYEKGSPLFQISSGFTDKNGCFEGLPYQLEPGFYVLSVNYLFPPGDDYPFPTVFYPNAKTKDDAKIFELNTGKDFDEIVFRLPPRMVKKEINLTILWDDGNPAEEVMADLENHEHWNYYENHGWITDEDGFVEMSLYADSGYQIKVNATRLIDGKETKYYVESEVFELGDKTLDFKLILKPKK
jgi:hypothetical protein